MRKLILFLFIAKYSLSLNFTTIQIIIGSAASCCGALIGILIGLALFKLVSKCTEGKVQDEVVDNEESKSINISQSPKLAQKKTSKNSNSSSSTNEKNQDTQASQSENQSICANFIQGHPWMAGLAFICAGGAIGGAIGAGVGFGIKWQLPNPTGQNSNNFIDLQSNTSMNDTMLQLKNDSEAKTQSIRQQAIGIAYSGNSIADLANMLKGIGSTPLEKAFAIFCWICDNIAYNVDGYLSGHYGDNSAGAVLINKLAVCEGQANLQEALAKEMQINCEKVVGQAKGLDYSPENPIPKEGEANHAWNKIEIDGNWQLLDSTWAAGYSSVNPVQLIIDHYPTKTENQLLTNPISWSAFFSMVQTTKEFFKYGFMEIIPNNIKITAVDTLELQLKKNDSSKVALRIELQCPNSANWLTEWDNDNFPFSQSLQNQVNNTINITVRLPKQDKCEINVQVAEFQQYLIFKQNVEIYFSKGPLIPFPQLSWIGMYDQELLWPLDVYLSMNTQQTFSIRNINTQTRLIPNNSCKNEGFDMIRKGEKSFELSHLVKGDPKIVIKNFDGSYTALVRYKGQ